MTKGEYSYPWQPLSKGENSSWQKKFFPVNNELYGWGRTAVIVINVCLHHISGSWDEEGRELLPEFADVGFASTGQIGGVGGEQVVGGGALLSLPARQ